jgi:hypothetical protein
MVLRMARFPNKPSAEKLCAVEWDRVLALAWHAIPSFSGPWWRSNSNGISKWYIQFVSRHGSGSELGEMRSNEQ